MTASHVKTAKFIYFKVVCTEERSVPPSRDFSLLGIV